MEEGEKRCEGMQRMAPVVNVSADSPVYQRILVAQRQYLVRDLLVLMEDEH